MRNLKLIVAFDGTNFSGWQKQSNAPTIQGELERVLGKITNNSVILHGAGRTDAGVHAYGMAASFKTDSLIPLPKLLRGANSILPSAIRILEIKEADPDFHARFSTTSKTYLYTIETGAIQSPVNRLYAVHIPQDLAIEAMQQCLDLIIGTHDFASFEASGSRDKSITTGRGSIRTLQQANVHPTTKNTLQFVFTGDGFLRHMVRNIVGTVLEVGKGRKTVQGFKVILEAKDRSVASATAPAHGLFLKKVQYNKE
ncbi:tRNA pseudouridine(38-40) synthase TruA [Desulfotalea psychrophila]|uniref:tRNA pseudouridine synthase A n=1 Tax=Desulfotalea psychrophila TaxID=84980 RepID=A0ABS3AVT7_9BACT|nr:tRNA pseudouridine(38-40) synthase TruA [Desulfocapsa sp.]MBN4068918.1 tRNA pseudouridine(38-40) synthase TruA [Desulfotalea psychrophila]MBN4071528.1 tRNA pseudouridine(38-40) synthase TruA [Desulfotalea psychrophila]